MDKNEAGSVGTEGKKMSGKRKGTNPKIFAYKPNVPQSNELDVVDKIYKEKDPIEASLQQRMAHGGCVRSVVRCRAKNMSHFFFTLRLKAPDKEMPPSLSESRIPDTNESPVK